jgi:hypothetical protein
MVQDNRHVILFEMRNIGKGGDKTYYAGFSFNLETNDFFIDFYNKDKKLMYNQVHTSLIKRFEEFYTNLNIFKLYNTCAHCLKYSCVSTPIELDFINKTVDDVNIEYEYFGMSSRIDNDTYKIYRLLNYPDKNKSNLLCFHAESDAQANVSYPAPTEIAEFNLPMIKFVSAKETYARITKLLLFS